MTPETVGTSFEKPRTLLRLGRLLKRPEHAVFALLHDQNVIRPHWLGCHPLVGVWEKLITSKLKPSETVPLGSEKL